MRLLRTGTVVALLASLLAFAPGAGAALVGIYRNPMESKGQLGQITKLSGDRCGRAGSSGMFEITIGAETKECSYRTPVLGRDLEIAATMRLLGVGATVPMGVQRSAFLALDLRAGDGGRYQLAVYPLQRKAQLRKLLPSGGVEYLHIEKGLTVGGIDQPNDLRLSAFNITEGEGRGDCQVLAYVGDQLIADVTDEATADLTGRASGFSLGSAKVAKGVRASVDDLVVRVPSPF